MSLKSFFNDFKKLAGLYSVFILVEIFLTLVLFMLLYITSSIAVLSLIFVFSFICMQIYIYYEFQKRLIKKVYDPEFKNNKNIIILIAIAISVFVLYIFFFIGAIINMFANPIMIYKFIGLLDNIKFLSYIISIAFIWLYTYLLFDIKKISKNIYISLSFFLIQAILSLLLIGIGTIIILILVYILSFLSWLGGILLVLIFLAFLTFVMTLYKTLYVQLVKYFKEENKVESKINQLLEKIKDFFKNIIN